MQEFELVYKAKKGDLKAMEELLDQNYAILKGYLLKITLDRELAADLTQETMLKALKKIKKFKNRSKFSTWLISIGTNLYKDHLRKNHRLIMVEDIDKLQVGILEAKETDLIITELLAELPLDKRLVLVLKHYFGYNYQEIGQMLNCPVGTVKSRMYYCMNFLRKRMTGGEEDE